MIIHIPNWHQSKNFLDSLEPAIRVPAMMKQDPITGISAPDSNRNYKNNSSSLSPIRQPIKRNEISKLNELTAELDFKIKKTLKSTNYRNEYANIQSAG